MEKQPHNIKDPSSYFKVGIRYLFVQAKPTFNVCCHTAWSRWKANCRSFSKDWLTAEVFSWRASETTCGDVGVIRWQFWRLSNLHSPAVILLLPAAPTSSQCVESMCTCCPPAWFLTPPVALNFWVIVNRYFQPFSDFLVFLTHVVTVISGLSKSDEWQREFGLCRLIFYTPGKQEVMVYHLKVPNLNKHLNPLLLAAVMSLLEINLTIIFNPFCVIIFLGMTNTRTWSKLSYPTILPLASAEVSPGVNFSLTGVQHVQNISGLTSIIFDIFIQSCDPNFWFLSACLQPSHSMLISHPPHSVPNRHNNHSNQQQSSNLTWLSPLRELSPPHPSFPTDNCVLTPSIYQLHVPATVA